jgi:hypothetical protein
MQVFKTKFKKNLCAIVLLFSATSFYCQNYIDRYLTNPLVFTTIGTASNGISVPNDLDFRPNSNELWVVNRGDAGGGSITIFYNAGQPNQKVENRKDSHSGHFMPFTSSIAFSETGEWASANEIKNTADPSSTFMGPALWSADTNIFARVFQNNWQSGFPLGSHLSMLHQSPFAMGIAHDTARVYWLFDGWNSNLCKYDFSIHHSPGYDDHSSGKIYRYTDVSLTRMPNIPSHLVLDKQSKWLYIINGGPKQLLRVNTLTGTLGPNLNVPQTAGELLTQYRSTTGAVKQILATYTFQPSGIDYATNRLIVGNYDNGDIYIYSTSTSSPTLLGTIATGQSGLTGLKLGTDGRIWYTNATQNKVVRIDVSAGSNDASISEISSPFMQNQYPNYHSPYYNFCGPNVSPSVVLKNNGNNPLTQVLIISSIDGAVVNTFTWSGNLANNASVTVNLPSIILSEGEHQLSITSANPNGLVDSNTLNDRKAGGFRVMDATYQVPYYEDFSSTTFPPSGWSYIGHNRYCKMSRNPNLGSNSSGGGCLQMDNTSGTDDISGQQDYFISPKFDLSNASTSTLLKFDVAYAQYRSSTNDRLEVLASSDCGSTWQSIYNQAGAALATVPPTTGVFIPEWYEWRRDLVYITNFIGKPEVLFLFKTTSNYGNNLYLDSLEISFEATVGLDKLNKKIELNLFPNPTNSLFTIQTNEPINELSITNLLGSKIKDYNFLLQPTKIIQLDVTDLPAGTYFITVTTGSGTLTKKLILTD